MSERWIALLAAGIGVVGGVGGAAIGGSIANQGQRERSQTEREAQIQDLLVDTYSSYIRTAGGAYFALAGNPGLSDAKKSQLIGAVEGGQAEVVFITASDDVAQTSDRIEELLTELANGTPVRRDTYRDARNDFITAAEQSIEEP
jgi:hypothetical protein